MTLSTPLNLITMSSTDSSEDHAMADTMPSGSRGTMEADHLLQRSLATYRYENALVKTELSATLERHTREMEELKLKYETQLREAERQRMAAERQLSEVQDAQSEKHRKLQQSNLQLQQKIKVMEEEVEAGVRALDKMVKEKTKAEEELQQHTLSQQTTLQALKGEKNQLRETVDNLRGELDKERTTVQELTTTLNSERHQQQLIKSRLSEVEQQCRVQLTAAQNEVSQLRHIKDQEATAASKRINELMNTVEEEKSVLSRVKERFAAKELELEKRMTEERQSHLSSSHQLAQQNSQLQDQLKVLEATAKSAEEKRDTRESKFRAEVDQMTEKLHGVEKEKAVLEARVASLEGMEGLLRREREDSSSLRQELLQHQAEVQQLKVLNKDLHLNIQQLNNQVSEARSQYSAVKEDAKKEREVGDRLLADLRSSHQEELEQRRARISTLETLLAEKNRKHLEESNQLKQKVRNYGSLIKKLRFKLEIGVVQVEQLEAQRAALQDNVPANVYRHLQSQLRDITRKHYEFAAFIRGLSEFQSTLPEMAELTTCIGAVGQKLSELEVDQLHCLSELESL
nr:plectin-like isoform X2 [Procambarus clarkii]